MYRVLAFSGGGIRGCFTTTLLSRLRVPYDAVDALSGTSTGSIIACGLAFGLKPKDLTQFYLQHAPVIFHRPFYRFKTLDRMFGAPYDLNVLVDACKKVFGDTRLGDLKKKVLISSYDLDAMHNGQRQAKAKFFHNFDAPRHDKDTKVWEAIAASVAAISYFRPFRNRFTDGGLVENHSGLALLSQLMHPRGGVGANSQDVYQLALGTGAVPKYMDSTQQRSWNLLDSLKTAIDSVTQANVSVADHVLESFLGTRYFRLDQPLSQDVELDDHEKMMFVIHEAERVDVGACQAWIDRHFVGRERLSSIA